MPATATINGDRLVLRTALPELAQLATWIQQVTRSGHLNDELAFALQLCLEEAVANIVMYGGLPETATIVIEIAQSAGVVTATVADGGLPFDPTQVPPRQKPASLDEARVGDLGIHLIRQYSSEMHYERRGNRNILTLRFDRSNAPAART